MLAANGGLFCLLLLVAGMALALGSVRIAPGELLAVLVGKGETMHRFILIDLRGPRVVTAAVVGGALGLSGCLMQTLARNRLATPGIIGIDNAATAFAVASVTGAVALPPTPMALLGATLAAALAFTLAGRTGTRGYRFIVAGIGIGAIAMALTQLMLSRVAIDVANAAYPWTMGSLNARPADAVLLPALGLPLALVAALALKPQLRLMLLSEPAAIGLGASPGRARLVGLMLSVVLTALAVAVAGPIGLVSLLGPEVARSLNRAGGVPLVGAMLAGAVILVGSDLLGRVLLAPLEVPVGIVTAILGSPWLLWILLRPKTGISL